MRLAFSISLVASSVSLGQIVVYDPWMRPVVIAPSPVAVVQPTATQQQPAARSTVPKPRSEMIERFYFLGGSSARRSSFSPSNSSQSGSAGTEPAARTDDYRDVQRIVREYHYYDDPTPRAADQAASKGSPNKDPLPALGDEPAVKVPKAEEAEKGGAAGRDANYPPTSAKPIVVSGQFASSMGGTELSDMTLSFVQQRAEGESARFKDRSTTTDKTGRYRVELEPGKWMVFFLLPDRSGKKFLRTVTVTEGSSLPINFEG